MRAHFLLSLIITVATLCTAFIMSALLSLTPCTLCTLQRFCYGLIGVTSLIALMRRPYGMANAFYTLLNIVWCFLGLALAGRQIWLQYLPPSETPACAPAFDVLLNMFGPLKAIWMSIQGDGDCAKVEWSFLSLSIAEWSLVIFVMLLLINTCRPLISRLALRVLPGVDIPK